MWTAKWILDAYEEGDESVRWDLYMAYPELRSCFDEIESSPRTLDAEDASKAGEKPDGAWWEHCCRMVRG